MPRLIEMSSLLLLDNSLLRWLIAAAVTLGALMLLLGLRGLMHKYYKRMQASPRTELLEIPLQVLSGTTLLFILVLALFIGSQTLVIEPKIQRVIVSVITIASFWQAGAWTVAAVAVWLEHRRRYGMEKDRAAVGSLGIIGFILNVAIWTMVVLLTLDNLGINITALVAGLGIGGIAVALAVQNVLGDLFASLSITLDRPFVIGDFLIVDNFLGSVEYIGIKSTRLRSLSGEQIIMSNSDLLGSRVRNYGRMNERRVVFQTRIAYETPIEKVEGIGALIREIIEAQPDTRFDRSHFAIHGVTSLEFETVYYVLSPDYNRYMDIQQAINVRLHRELAKRGIQFAYPTQRLLIGQGDPHWPPGAAEGVDQRARSAA